MSRPIDEKIVQLTLDNKQFEKNAEKSIETFKNMNKSMSHSTVDLSGIQNAVQKCADRFTLMGTISQEILERIAIKAVDVGERVTRALTVQGAFDGYQEYQLKLQSIQTIMNNTGRNIKDVSKALDELNEYADQTVFVFSDMTRQIGDVTASSGMGLEDAVKAIKGAYNAAAFFGKDSTHATMAMTQFSQAIAANKMQLIDWKSIQTDGLGGPTMQRALVAAAQKTGKLTESYDELIKKHGSFREMISGKNSIAELIDADAIKLALQAFADPEVSKQLGEYDAKLKNLSKTASDSATKIRSFGKLIETVSESIGSGWAHTWEVLIGDYEEAGELWTAIGTPILKFTDNWMKKQNEVLDSWDKLGGRTALLNGLANCFKLLGKVVTPVKDAFKNLFPEITGERLADISKKFEDFTKKFDKLDFSKWTNFWDGITDKLQKVKDLFGGFGDTVKKVVDKATEYLSFSNLLKGGGLLLLLKNITPLITGFRDLYDTVGLFGTLRRTFQDGGIIGVLTGRREDIEDAKGGLEEISEGFSSLGAGVKLAGIAGILLAVSQVAKAIDILSNIDEDKAQQGITLLTVVMGELLGLTNFAKRNITGAATLIMMATAVQAVSLALAGLSLVDSDKLSGAVIAIGFALGELVVAAKAMEDTSSLLGGATLIEIAIAIDLLTASIAGLAFIDGEKLAASLFAIAGGLVEMVAAVKVLSGMDNPLQAFTTFIAAGSLILVATAIDILTASLVALSLVDSEKLGQSLLVLGGALTEIVAVSYLLEGAVVGVLALAGAGVALSLIGAAMIELATACAIMQFVKWDKVGEGLKTFLKALGIGMVSMLMAGPGAKALKNAAPGLTALAAVLVLLKSVNIERVGTALSECLVSLAKGLTLMIVSGPGANALSKAAVGLVALADAVKVMAPYDITAVGTGLGTLLSSMAVGLTLMIAALPGALGLLVAAPALLILSKSLMQLQMSDLATIGDGMLHLLAGLAGGLTAMIISLPGALALLVAAPAISSLSKSLKTLKGVNLTTIGEGLKIIMQALAGGLTAMIAAGPGAGALKKAAPALGDLAASLKEVKGLPLISLGNQIRDFLSCLGAGLNALWGTKGGANSLSIAAPAIGTLATALTTLKDYKFGTIAGDLYDLLSNIGKATKELNSGGKGAEAFNTLAPALTTFTDAVIKINGVKMDDIKKKLDDILTPLSDSVSKMKDAVTGAEALNTVIPNLEELFKSVQNISKVKIDDKFGENLGKVMTSVSDAAKEMKDAGAGAEAIATVSGPLTDIATALNLCASIKKNVVAVGSNIGDALGFIAEGVEQFTSFNAAKNISEAGDGIHAVAEVMNMLGQMDNISVKGTALGTALEHIGDGINHFISKNATDYLSSAGDGLLKIKDVLIGLQEIKTIAALGTRFGTAIERIGDGIDYIQNVDGIKELSTLATGLGKIKDVFTGIKEAGEITVKGNALGHALEKIGDGSEHFKNAGASSNLTSAGNGIQAVATALVSLNQVDNILQKGNSLGHALQDIAVGVQQFQSSGAGATTLSTAASGITELSEIITKIGGQKIDMKTDGPLQSMNTFLATMLGNISNHQESIAAMSELGPSLESFSTGIDEIVTQSERISQVVENINSLTSVDFGEAFGTLGTTVSESLSGVQSTLEEALSGMLNSLSANKEPIANNAKSLGEEMSKALETACSYDNGNNSGKNFIQGFIDGMESLMGPAIDKATSVGSSAYEALRKSIEERSPSRKTFRSGVNFVLGFVNAVTSKFKEVGQATSKLGNYALDGFRNTGIMNPEFSPIIDFDDIMRNRLIALPDVSTPIKDIERIQNGLAPAVRQMEFSQQDIMASNAEVIGKLDELNENLSKLANRPIHVEQTIDGKTTSSAIAKYMDKDLAIIQKRRR